MLSVFAARIPLTEGTIRGGEATAHGRVPRVSTAFNPRAAHLSYVQANDRVSHYAPVGVVAKRLAKTSFFAVCALVLRAFSRIAEYSIVNVL